MRPGIRLFTRIFCGASSIDSVLASAATDARRTFDSARLPIGSFTDEEVPTRIDPPPRACIEGTTRRAVRITLRTSRSKPLCHAASSKLNAAPAGGPPVLAYNRSTPPNASTVARCQASIAGAALKSPAVAITVAPVSFLIAAAARSTASRSRDAIDTRAPSAASARATA